MTDDIDDGSTKPLGHTSDDECLEVRQNARGEKEYVETELGQHDRWMLLAPDLFEKYMALVEEVAVLRLKPAAPAPAERTCGTALRNLRDAIAAAYGDEECCDGCDALDAPCVLHRSVALYRAMLAADEALGPCPCGHTRSQHHDEDTTKCRVCECPAFRLPKPPVPSPRIETP